MTNILQITSILQDNVKTLPFLRQNKLFSSGSFCENCHIFRRQVNEVILHTYPDKYIWRCGALPMTTIFYFVFKIHILFLKIGVLLHVTLKLFI